MARSRGGYRKPANPAAVSGPGASSARTDGGPGQPIRVAPGGDYGDRKAMVAQQSAAPMAQASSGNPAVPAQSGRQAGPVSFGEAGAFSPTARPNESMLAGLEQKPALSDNPYLQLQALAANPATTTPYLRDLVNRMRGA